MAEPTERIAILLELQQAEFEKRAKSAGAAIDRLERKFNPLAAAENRLTKEQTRFNAALEAGTIDAAQHAKGLDLLQREYDGTASRLSGATNNVIAMNGAVASSTGFMNRNRSIFQQAGYQVGDFAVQVQGGQSALTAFTQQGSQLLGVFGPMGAVLGAALAVGAPLIAFFMRGTETAGEFKERSDALTSAVNAYSTAVTNAQIPTAELEAKYGSAAEAAAVFAQALTSINKAIALEALTAGQAIDAIDVDRLRNLIEFINSVPENSQFISTKYMQSIEALQEEFGTTEAQARMLLDALDAFGNAKGPEQVVAAGEDLLAVITNTFGPLESLTGEALNLAVQVREVSDSAAELVGVIEDNTFSMREFVDAAYASGAAIASAFPSADTMLSKLQAMAGAAWDYAGGLGAAQMQSSEQGRRGAVDPRTVGGRAIDIQTAEAGEFLRTYKPPPPPPPSGGGGGRGSRSSGGGGREQTPLFDISEDQLQRIQRQIDLLGKSAGQVAELTAKHRLLDEAKKRGMAITEELTAKIDAEAAEVGQLAEQYDQARDKIAAMEKMQGEFKDSIIDAAMGGADAMDAFKDSIKRAALEYALFGSGLFAGGGAAKKGGFAGLLGGIFSGLSFDGGGYTGNGARTGGLDGKGGMMVMIHPQETIIDHTKGRSARTQGGVAQVQVIGGDLMLSDNGQIMARVQVVADSRIGAAGRRQADQKYLQGGR